MSRTRVLFCSIVVAAALLTGSCSPDSRTPTGVTAAQPSTDLSGALLSATGLLKCSPLPYATTTQTVGPAGGLIQVGPHSLFIPAGALAQPVTITAVLPVAPLNAVHFWPQGLQFSRPAYLTMSYANCNLLGQLLPKRIAYTTDNFQILNYLLSWDLFSAERVTGQVNHFSTYAVAW